ncbi:DUF4129 domain-containing protein [Fulvivirga sp. RKSG066]|uniref:DUF4129 domain-containing protein n=1 Tax=Fulvivirga aurantia TaxID=2529383 RepID=UPI0012BC315C|nr:DUF4129 domain-containing protein [Fulvivirga aurantia]MTI20151.1 DUF4129 domain-containing protein [Fulvivirga aurantia]
MKSIISLLLFVLFASLATANDSTSLKNDNSQLELRKFDEEKIKQHKADEDFDYGSKAEAELTLWQRFKIWLNRMLMKLFQFGTDTPIGKIILYVILGAGIIYAIYKIATMQSVRLFNKTNGNSLDYEVYHEDIHQMDFQKLIDEAIQNKNYRLAIRLTYLLALKHLSDKNLIDWQPGKTNYDYTHELNRPNLKPGFNDLSYYFDYTWYGDFEVNEPLFNKVNGLFTQWKKQLES